ncbi:hypothetical protein SmJEL517_g05065 [Synchytrium microbalum]|uniref:Elongin-C n=1 Tax=Synchytrium microbalum TaxID=1806994 RepID=A0A507C0S7_9FUNG|nr:uncharacterized protein SmJEL517_g05065 [Synchytrium microbalum]TPX31664.1 hypothetical protein SmJEL517_g05065 [Synchytrium microbalum]
MTDTVKLISSDGFEFVIDRKCAMASGTLKNMLSSPGTLFVTLMVLEEERQFTESIQNEIRLRDMKAIIVEKVCKYLYYKVKYSNATSDIPPFPMENDLALELLMAADFLDV